MDDESLSPLEGSKQIGTPISQESEKEIETPLDEKTVPAVSDASKNNGTRPEFLPARDTVLDDGSRGSPTIMKIQADDSTANDGKCGPPSSNVTVIETGAGDQRGTKLANKHSDNGKEHKTGAMDDEKKESLNTCIERTIKQLNSWDVVGATQSIFDLFESYSTPKSPTSDVVSDMTTNHFNLVADKVRIWDSMRLGQNLRFYTGPTKSIRSSTKRRIASTVSRRKWLAKGERLLFWIV